MGVVWGGEGEVRDGGSGGGTIVENTVTRFPEVGRQKNLIVEGFVIFCCFTV